MKLILFFLPLALLAQIPVAGGGSGGGGTPGVGCTVSGSAGQIVYNNGSTGCSSSTATVTSGGAIAAPQGVSTGASPPSVTPGTGGLFGFAEGTVPSVGAAAGVDICYGDATQHGVLCSYNNAAYLPDVQGPASSTVGHYAQWNSTTGGLLKDATIAAADLPAALSSSTSLNGVTMGSAVGNATIAQTVAAGSTAMGTPTVTSGACSSAITATATGGATTDVISASPAVDPSGVSGYAASASGSLFIVAWVTSNTANFKLCNNTSGSITPAAMSMNWRISR